MAYTIDWIGSVGMGVVTEGGRPIAFSLEPDQQIPEEFKVGDVIEITNHPEHPAVIEMEHNRGFYEITHLASGKAFRIRHSADQWRLE